MTSRVGRRPGDPGGRPRGRDEPGRLPASVEPRGAECVGWCARVGRFANRFVAGSATVAAKLSGARRPRVPRGHGFGRRRDLAQLDTHSERGDPTGTRDLRRARPAPLLDVTRLRSTTRRQPTSFDYTRQESTGPLAPRSHHCCRLRNHQSKDPAIGGFLMERAGFEPAPSGLQSRATGDGERRRSARIARNHAGLRTRQPLQSASLHDAVRSRLGVE